MLSKLVLQNISQKKFRNLLAIFSITIATASLFLFLGLKNGITQTSFTEAEKQNPLTQITVRPQVEQTSLLGFLSKSQEGKLNKQTIAELEKIDGIKRIHLETQFNSFATLSANLLGFNFITDSMIFGLEKEFIENDLKNPQIWQAENEPYPALVPRKLLDLYNFALAAPQNLPTISEESLLGKRITLYPNYSTFFPSMSQKTAEIELEVVGFSDKINLIGVSLPYQIIEKLNKTYTNSPNETYVELFVETEDPEKTPQIAAKIEELGHSTEYYQKNIQSVQSKLKYLSLTIAIISAIIVLSSAISIIGIFLAIAEERKKEIGLFRALGATKIAIRNLILAEALIIGIIGSIMGILIASIAGHFLDGLQIEQITQGTLALDSLFLFNIETFVVVMIFGSVLSVLSAYFPAKIAANIDPIEALE